MPTPEVSPEPRQAQQPSIERVLTSIGIKILTKYTAPELQSWVHQSINQIAILKSEETLSNHHLAQLMAAEETIDKIILIANNYQSAFEALTQKLNQESDATAQKLLELTENELKGSPPIKESVVEEMTLALNQITDARYTSQKQKNDLFQYVKSRIELRKNISRRPKIATLLKTTEYLRQKSNTDKFKLSEINKQITRISISLCHSQQNDVGSELREWNNFLIIPQFTLTQTYLKTIQDSNTEEGTTKKSAQQLFNFNSTLLTLHQDSQNLEDVTDQLKEMNEVLQPLVFSQAQAATPEMVLIVLEVATALMQYNQALDHCKNNFITYYGLWNRSIAENLPVSTSNYGCSNGLNNRTTLHKIIDDKGQLIPPLTALKLNELTENLNHLILHAEYEQNLKAFESTLQQNKNKTQISQLINYANQISALAKKQASYGLISSQDKSFLNQTFNVMIDAIAAATTNSPNTTTLSDISAQCRTVATQIFPNATPSRQKTIEGCLLAVAGILLIAASVAVAIVTHGGATPLSLLGIKLGLGFIGAAAGVGAASTILGVRFFATRKPPEIKIKETLVKMADELSPPPTNATISA